MHFPSSHPVILQKVSALRDAETRPAMFRQLVRELSILLAYEATADLPTVPTVVLTPLGASPGHALADRIAIVPILRAGLGMADGLLEVLPDAEVWHIGLFRDEETLKPTEYYNKIHDRCRAAVAIVVDPMLATGGSAIRTCEILRASGVARIKFISLIAAPEGIKRFAVRYPDVPIHVGAVDERLTDVGFIYPGLGDAGDRQFATS